MSENGDAYLDLRPNDSARRGIRLLDLTVATSVLALALSLKMFQNSGIQSSWTSQQPNQQQPQQPQQPQTGSVFGQPNAFGAGGGGGRTHTASFELALSSHLSL
jgi:hypothetical protein